MRTMRTSSWRGAALTLMVVPALQGCASLAEERARFVQGWRPGRIVQIDTGTAVRAHSWKDCRSEVSPQTAATSRYAVVRYSEAPSRYAYRVAPLPHDGTFGIGDRVQVNIDDCSAALEPVRER